MSLKKAELLFSLWKEGQRQLKLKWKGNVFGLAWVFLHPALEILLYYVIFSNLLMIAQTDARFGEHYLFYLCIGIVPWSIFSDSVYEGSVSLVSNGYYLKKVSKPFWFFILGQGIASGLTLLMGLSMLMVMALLCGYGVSFAWLGLLWVSFCLTLLMAGISCITSVLTVYFKDFKDALSVFLKFVFWSMPLIYFKESVPTMMQTLIDFHPFYLYIEHLRVIFLEGGCLSPVKMALGLFLPVLLLAVGLSMQRKTEGAMRDIL